MEYKIRSSGRARALSVTVYPGGAVVVTKPKWLPDSAARRFVARKMDWIRKHVSVLQNVAPRKRLVHTKAEYTKRRADARRLIEARVAHFNTLYNHPFGCISIRNQKSRWGSCSKKGTLSFNYRLLFLPDHLLDYVVVHELCHLRHFNHSKKFWDLVAQTVPDYRERRRQLRNQQDLFL